MSYPDIEAVDKIVLGTLVAAGFVNKDGSIDDEALKDAVYQRMIDKHVLDDPKQMAKTAVTAFELYAAVLPAGPGVSRQPATEEESLARDKLQRKLWGYTNTG